MSATIRATTVALVLAFCVASSATAAPAASTGGNAKAWCAAVIQINTKYGTMKNKTDQPQAWLNLSVRKAVIEAALRNKGRRLAITPSEIKTAMAHELVWFAHMKAWHDGPIASSLPMMVADAEKLSAFQRTKCGIKGA